MTPQVVVNAKALVNLAAKLEQLGYAGDDVHEVAEHIALNLLADGNRPLEKPPPPRPLNLATDEQRRQHLTTIRADLAAAKRKSQEGKQ